MSQCFSKCLFDMKWRKICLEIEHAGVENGTSKLLEAYSPKHKGCLDARWMAQFFPRVIRVLHVHAY